MTESEDNNNSKRAVAPATTGDSGEEPPAKKSKSSTTTTTTPGWNAASDADNKDDLFANDVPLLPRDYRYLLLDIEGCTTAISFVKDVLFPYVVEHVEGYLAENLSAEEKATLAEDLKKDLTAEQLAEVGKGKGKEESQPPGPVAIVKYMVANDLKVASLKSLQGKMWKDGYSNGTLKGHVYQDFVPMLEWTKEHDVEVYIYSSGSVQAQKLLFGNSIKGDLTPYFSGHFDITTSGNKKQSGSYAKIAGDLGVPPGEIVFCSDAVAELEAALEAGIGRCVMTIRPGNAPLSKEASEKHPKVFSLLQLCGSGL